jgi:hypothetical protein
LLLGRSSISAATAASTIAITTAAVAAVATAVAAMMATMMATTTAATAIAAVAAVAAAAATMTEGHRLVVTAQEGDADDREENRETENNNTIHPQILQLLTGTVSENYRACRHDNHIATTDGSVSQCDLTLCGSPHSSLPDLGPCCQILRVTKDIAIAKIRS